MGRGSTNVEILPGHDHSRILPAGSEALLGCKGTMVSHNFPSPRGTLANLGLLRNASIFGLELGTSHSAHALVHHPRPLDHTTSMVIGVQILNASNAAFR